MLSLGSFKTGAILLVSLELMKPFDLFFCGSVTYPTCLFSIFFTLICAFQAGLFVYDIFWVFFTPVMVSVAKSFDAPIKVSLFVDKYVCLGLSFIV